jgi:hypothetical protein
MPIWFILGITGVVSVILLWEYHRRRRRAEKAGKEVGIILEIVRDLGIGGLVSCVVGLAVEFSLYLHAEKLHAEISKDVFKAVFGHPLDEKLKKEIQETIFQSLLIREQFTVSYEFEASKNVDQPAGVEKLLDLTVTISYDLKNTGLEPTMHTISPSFGELPTLGPRVGQFLSLDVRGNERNKQIIHLEGPDITQYDNQERSLRNLPNGGRFTIDSNQVVSIKWVYKTQRRYADKYTWVTVQPAQNLTLIVKKKGKEVADLTFVPDTAHRVQHPEQQKAGPGGRPLEEGESIWTIDAAFLPYQGIFLDWYPASKVKKP